MVISARYVAAMIDHARQEFPNEACGLLGTQDGVVREVYPVRNADASPVHYRMDPQEQLRATLEIEDRGWDLGIYHSHTHTRAYPSQTDVSLAYYPDAAYVIVSLARPDAPEVRAFRIVEGQISEEAVEIAGE